MNIREERKKLDLTQEKLATLSNVSRITVLKAEQKKIGQNKDSYKRIVATLLKYQ